MRSRAITSAKGVHRASSKRTIEQLAPIASTLIAPVSAQSHNRLSFTLTRRRAGFFGDRQAFSGYSPGAVVDRELGQARGGLRVGSQGEVAAEQRGALPRRKPLCVPLQKAEVRAIAAGGRSRRTLGSCRGAAWPARPGAPRGRSTSVLARGMLSTRAGGGRAA
jgi:hypothetical protein